MADCEQPTRTPTKLRSRQFQRFILSRLTVGVQIRHGNPPFLRLTAEFERSEKPATSSKGIDAALLAGGAMLLGHIGQGRGITVDRYLRTSVPGVFAAGD